MSNQHQRRAGMTTAGVLASLSDPVGAGYAMLQERLDLAQSARTRFQWSTERGAILHALEQAAELAVSPFFGAFTEEFEQHKRGPLPWQRVALARELLEHYVCLAKTGSPAALTTRGWRWFTRGEVYYAQREEFRVIIGQVGLRCTAVLAGPAGRVDVVRTATSADFPMQPMLIDLFQAADREKLPSPLLADRLGIFRCEYEDGFPANAADA